ncbi:MAG: hypothetical protein P1U46_00270 [Patescibacteria group bacterium]|nr:hypothetical protein [Patescibacteria group bacterium]
MIVITNASRFIISQNLAFSISYLTFTTGEKLVSTNKTSTSSSLSFNSSCVKYHTHFSTLISISSSKPSLSISVIYKSLFKIFIHQTFLISDAVTFQDLFLVNFNHSTQISDLDKTNHLIFRIISSTESLTQGRVEYS